jgi:RimJ/RimL family protein N-acetyltransferase
MTGAAPLVTKRMTLVPATPAHVRAEIGDHAALAGLLGAAVPENWPPESTAAALPLFLVWMEAAPERAGWFGWYALFRQAGPGAPVLVGSGGFLGPPRDGEAGIGYAVLPQFQGRGFATELAGALVGWALGHPDVLRVAAETGRANPASVRVLAKLGFEAAGTGCAPGGQRFTLCRPGVDGPSPG